MNNIGCVAGMSRSDIMRMPAGPALDRLIAAAMGDGEIETGACAGCGYSASRGSCFYSVQACCSYHCRECGFITPAEEGVRRKYSTDIGKAWLVWERLPPGIDYNPLRLECDLDSDDWIVGYGMDEMDGGAFLPGADDPFGKPARGNTVPLAICRAFLVISSDKSLVVACAQE